MKERDVLEQRSATLHGLLSSPTGPLGPNAGKLGDRLRAGWETEVRLIERLLSETPGDDVLSTIGAWRARTDAFVARSPTDAPCWTDKHGQTWDARAVLSILDDLRERIERWMLASHAASPGEEKHS